MAGATFDSQLHLRRFDIRLPHALCTQQGRILRRKTQGIVWPATCEIRVIRANLHMRPDHRMFEAADLIRVQEIRLGGIVIIEDRAAANFIVGTQLRRVLQLNRQLGLIALLGQREGGGPQAAS
jgi:hypothetical protein